MPWIPRRSAVCRGFHSAAATRLGDGEPIDSWQQMAFRWTNQGNADETRAMPAQNPSSGLSPAAEPIAAASAQTAADATHDDSAAQANSVIVHVCVDPTGTIRKRPDDRPLIGNGDAGSGRCANRSIRRCVLPAAHLVERDAGVRLRAARDQVRNEITRLRWGYPAGQLARELATDTTWAGQRAPDRCPPPGSGVSV